MKDETRIRLIQWMIVVALGLMVVGVTRAIVMKVMPPANPRIGKVKIDGGWIYCVEGKDGIVFVPEAK